MSQNLTEESQFKFNISENPTWSTNYSVSVATRAVCSLRAKYL